MMMQQSQVLCRQVCGSHCLLHFCQHAVQQMVHLVNIRPAIERIKHQRHHMQSNAMRCMMQCGLTCYACLVGVTQHDVVW